MQKDGVVPTAPAEAEVVAYAVPVNNAAMAESSTASGSGEYLVDLPVGVGNIGVDFQRSPPVVSDIEKTCPIGDQLSVGHYCHGVVLPGVEIVNITDVDHLNKTISANASNPRKLLMSSSAYYIDPYIRKAVSYVLYKHTLPQGNDLGFLVSGFPPVITQVDPNSGMAGRLSQYQTVEALAIPGEPVFNLAAGAFTSNKLQERLSASSMVANRLLVVKDAPITPAEKGSSAAFDLKAFTNSSGWGIKRMFGK